MSPLSDAAVERLRASLDAPDLEGTRYQLLDRLGRGGMGSVFRVRDRELGREVALKVLTLPGGGELAERLRAEARVLARLEHPGIVPVHDVGTLADGRVFYVMKRVRGERLDELAARLGRSEPRPLLRLFARVCEAVAFAHDRGVLHRDLKPENVMAGDLGEVLVMDWGVAKLRGDGEPPGAAAEARAPAPGATAHGAVLGTPGYMAPEQAAGLVDTVDERSDVYGLGALLHFLLNGSPPAAAGAEAPSIGVPRRLAAICRKAHAEPPQDRYPSARELAADVLRFLDGQAVAAYREGWLERAARVARRHQALLALVLAYLAIRVALLLAARP